MKQFFDYRTTAVHLIRLPGYLTLKSGKIFLGVLKNVCFLFLFLLAHANSFAQFSVNQIYQDESEFSFSNLDLCDSVEGNIGIYTHDTLTALNFDLSHLYKAVNKSRTEFFRNTILLPPEPPGITVDYNCDGTATLTATGIDPGASILWSTGETNNPINITATGTYTVTQTLDGNTSEEGSITISAFNGLIIKLTHNNVLCFGGNSGRIVIEPLQGTPPYSYTVTPTIGPVITGSFNSGFVRVDNLIAGTYQVSVTDGNGCVFSESRTIIQPATPINASITATNAVCKNDKNGSAIITTIGGTPPYVYSLDGGNFISDNVFNNLPAGSHSIIVRDRNLCTFTATFNITEPEEIMIDPVVSPAVCTNANGRIEVQVTGGTPPYSFSVFEGVFQSDNIFQDLSAGFYTITVRDVKGCIKTASVEVEQAFSNIALSATVIDAKCTSATGSIDVTVSGGTAPFQFSWTGPGGYNSVDEDPANISSGYYAVVVTDANGCNFSTTVFVPQTTSQVTILPDITPATCEASNGAINLTINNGTAPYSFSWIGPNGFSSTDQNINNLVSGDYFLSFSDVNGCATTGNFTIPKISTALEIESVVNDEYCSAGNGSIELNISNGTAPYTFFWFGPGGFTSNDKDLNQLSSGFYLAIVTDQNGCTGAEAVNIENLPTNISVSSVVMDANCSGSNGAIEITVSGGEAPFEYLWTGPNGFTSTQQNISGIPAGDYNLIITDKNSCNYSTWISVLRIPSAISVTAAITQPVCSAANGAIDITVNNGTAPYTYAWTGPGGYTFNNEDPSGIVPGFYTVRITDRNGCSFNGRYFLLPVINTITVTEDITAANCIANNGAISLSVNGGNEPYTYSWTGPDGFTSSNQNITDLFEGNYQIRITDVNGCYVNRSFVVPQIPSNITASTSIINPNCTANNGAIDLTVSGGFPPFNYSWTGPGGYTFAGEDPTGLFWGEYFITITDRYGCSYFSVVTLEKAAETMAVAASVSNVDCNSIDGAIDITVTGGAAPFIYAWNSINGFTSASEDISGLVPDTYTVLVTDANGCTASTSVIMRGGISPFAISATMISASCKANDGSIDLTLIGGTAPIIYNWTGPYGYTFNGQDPTGIGGGTYTVVVTDANNCTISLPVVVNQVNSTLAPSWSVVDALCSPNTGSINLGVVGTTKERLT